MVFRVLIIAILFFSSVSAKIEFDDEELIDVSNLLNSIFEGNNENIYKYSELSSYWSNGIVKASEQVNFNNRSNHLVVSCNEKPTRRK